MLRELYNDWDFSEIGRLRQAMRMREMSTKKLMEGTSNLIICDFVAPTANVQNLIPANKFIWLDTVKKSRYTDTNKIFEQPRLYDFRVRKKNAKLWAQIIFDNIIGSVNDTIKIN
jgi:adenylylsulfate kinase